MKKWYCVIAVGILWGLGGMSLSAKAGVFAEIEPGILFQSKANAKDPIYREVFRRIRLKGEIQRSFIQQKTVSALPRPIRSNGIFLVSPKGICWRTTKPVQSSMMITPKGITQKVGNNAPTYKSTADSYQIKGIVRVMLDIFNGDEKSLGKVFDLFLAGSKDNWSIGLKPKRRSLAKHILNIQISGNSEVRTVMIREAGGNESRIEIHPLLDSSELSLENCAE